MCIHTHTHKHTHDNKHCAEYRRNQTQLNENLAMILMNILIFFCLQFMLNFLFVHFSEESCIFYRKSLHLFAVL